MFVKSKARSLQNARLTDDDSHALQLHQNLSAKRHGVELHYTDRLLDAVRRLFRLHDEAPAGERTLETDLPVDTVGNKTHHQQ